MNHSPCEGCTLHGRRDFLQQVAALAAATLGTPPAPLTGARLRVPGGTGVGDEIRYPLPTSDGAFIDRDNQVILVRYQGHLFAFNLSCPHQRTSLRWLAEEGRFQCPKHKSRYRPDGSFISGRATRGMDRLLLKRVGSVVVVSVGRLIRQDQDGDSWASASVMVK